jgi:LmbE family N-acetylglucosaminyl deacetylase
VTTLGQGGWHQGYNITREEVGQIRKQEQLNAAKVLGVTEVFFLGLEDGQTEGVDPVALKTNITKVIRTVQPDVTLTFDQNIDNYWGFKQGLIHRDHLVAGKAALDAAYPFARDWLSDPSIYPQYQPWDTPQLWLFNWGDVNAGSTGNFDDNDGLIVPIDDVFDIKYQALLQHKSQYTNATEVLESLQTIGSIVSKRNALPDSVQFSEAFTVVEIF